MDRFLLPKCPQVETETRERIKSNECVEDEQKNEDVSECFDQRERCQPSISSTDDAGVASIDDISQNPQDVPRRSILQKYPSRLFGTQQRSFSKGWLDQYAWMEYSVCKDSVFCFACRNFLKGRHGFHIELAFVANGFSNWRKASASLKSHHESAAHWS